MEGRSGKFLVLELLDMTVWAGTVSRVGHRRQSVGCIILAPYLPIRSDRESRGMKKVVLKVVKLHLRDFSLFDG